MADLRGITFEPEPVVIDGPCDPEDPTCDEIYDVDEIVQVENEDGTIQLMRGPPHRTDSLKVYYICNQNYEPLLAAPLGEPLEEDFPFLSATQIKCGLRKVHGKYLEAGRACDTSGAIVLSCDLLGVDTRIIITKIYPAIKPIFANKAEKKSHKARGKELAMAANEICGGDGIDTIDNSCTFSLADLMPEEEAPTEEYNVQYVCSYTEELNPTPETDPVLSTPIDNTEQEYPFLAKKLPCGSTEPRGHFVEAGKQCGDVSWELACDSTPELEARVIVIKVKPERYGPKPTGQEKRDLRKAGKERTKNANNFCGNPDNVVDGVCTIGLDDILAVDDTVEDGQLFDIKFLCSYGEPGLPDSP